MPVQDKSARESLQTFAGGKGDVLLAYENEAIPPSRRARTSTTSIPDQTILIENPVAARATASDAKTAKAFVDFLHTPKAQKIFASKGYRPVARTDTSGARQVPDAEGPVQHRLSSAAGTT